MTTNYKYRVYCTTDNKHKFTDWLATTPTVCPATGTHGIDTDKTSVVEVKGPSSNSRQTVVSNDPNTGDYTSVATAFADGSTSVFVKSGTYVESANIIIPNGGELIGENQGKTVIYFAGPYSVIIDGSNGIKETAGTVSITNNTSVVTGSGTAFNNLSIGNFILLGTTYYEILTVDSSTQVTLKKLYQGKTITNEEYTAQSMYTGNVLSNLIITSSLSTGVYIRGLRHGSLKELAIAYCSSAIEIVDSSDISIPTIIVALCTGIGFSITNCISLALDTVNVFNCTSHGFEIKGRNIIIESCASENNNGYGIHLLNDTEFITINNSVIKYNNNMGIKYETLSIYNTISNSEISNNNGDGLNIQSDNNITNSCFIHKNTGNGFICGSQNIINGNTIVDNTIDGIKIVSGSDSCILSNNIIKGNGGIGINLLADKCGINCNNIMTSGGDGIYTSGVKNKISSNTVIGNLGKGIHIDATSDDCVINGNIVNTSTGNGLELVIGATDNIISSNNLKGNTGTNYVDNGTGTIIANNK